MNPAIELIVERLKSNPDDFFGPLGKEDRVYKRPRLEYIERMMQRAFAPPRDEEPVPSGGARVEFWFLEHEDREVLRVAYTEATRERFIAAVLYNVMRPEEEKDANTVAGKYATNLGVSMTQTKNNILRGLADPRGVFGSAPVKLEGGAI